MEFRVVLQIVCALVLSMYACNTRGNTIETQGVYTEFMSRVPTLTCTFVSSTKWFFIRWERIDGDNNTALAIMTSSTSTPEWMETAPAHFKDHVYLKSDVKDGTVSLNMRIDGFICSDTGKYKCQVTTMSGDFSAITDLKIEAHPGTPVITESTIEVPENETFSIECKGNVGIPPQELRWAYKMVGQERYNALTDQVTHENRPTNDCTFQEISRVTLEMTPELDGAVFLCRSRGELGEGGTPMNFDEVTVIVHRPATTTTVVYTTQVIIIDESNTDAAVSTCSSIGFLIGTCVLSIVLMAFNDS